MEAPGRSTPFLDALLAIYRKPAMKSLFSKSHVSPLPMPVSSRAKNIKEIIH